MKEKRIAVFSGAGMSAESGISTFRDSGGLWEKFKIEEVATPEAWAKNPQKVLDFYNARVAQLNQAEPNQGHKIIAGLETHHQVTVITQNVDDLHERAGSTRVLHLHGELRKCRSSKNESEVLPIPVQGLKIGDRCSKGHQLRPHIVWFGEMVPNMDKAEQIVRDAEVLIIVGTSLNVYPAAGLAFAAQNNAEVWLVDPADFPEIQGINHIKAPASKGLEEVKKLLS